MNFLFASVLCSIIVTVCAHPGVLQYEKTVQVGDGGVTIDGEKGGAAGFHVAAALGGDVSAEAGSAGTSSQVGTTAVASSGSSAVAAAHASATATAGGATGTELHTQEAETTYGHKTINHKAEVVGEKTFTEAPKVVSEKTISGAAQVQRTVIEKTIIPQYVEKTIQEQSYVEKTIRVPTVVEHKVRVPVNPKVIEKTYESKAAAAASATATASAGANVNTPHKVVLQERPVTVHKDYSSNGGLFGGLFAHKTSSGNAFASANAHASAGAGAGVADTGAANVGTTTGNTGTTYSHSYKSNGGLIGNILSIPAATLGAVGNLFNSFGQQGSGGASFSVSKNYKAAF